MVNIDNAGLEKALGGTASGNTASVTPEEQKMSQEEEIGFHKGALNTLVNERSEIFKMIQNVETVMQVHLKRLEELGVKIQQQK